MNVPLKHIHRAGSSLGSTQGQEGGVKLKAYLGLEAHRGRQRGVKLKAHLGLEAHRGRQRGIELRS